MANARAKQFWDQLTPVLSAIKDVDPTELVQRERLGSELSFGAQLPLFTDIVNCAGKLLHTKVDHIPFNVVKPLVAPYQQIAQLLQQFKTFSPGADPQARENLIVGLENQWGSIFLPVRTLIGTANDETTKRDVEVLTSQVQSTIQLSSEALQALTARKAEAEKELNEFIRSKGEEFTNAGNEKLSQVASALDAVRKAAAEAGVSQTSRYFKDEADEHLIAARLWLGVLIGLIVALIGFSLFGRVVLAWAGTIEPASTTWDFPQIRYLSQKALIIVCLFFGLLWSARNYGASRHNYIVNKHRNNALGSFQAFASSAADEQTKSAVLIQATQSIFTPQVSGYVKTDGENSPSTPVVEILRSASKEK